MTKIEAFKLIRKKNVLKIVIKIGNKWSETICHKI